MDKHPKKLSKKKLIWLGIAGFIVIAVGSALWPDGSEKYSGAEKEAANVALKHARSNNESLNLGVLGYRVEAVESHDQSAEDRLCNGEFNGVNLAPSADRFKVLISQRTILGIKLYQDFYLKICRYDY